MSKRGSGLTAIYSLVNNAAVDDRDIERLRELHVEIDEAILDAYGWADIAATHDFCTYRQMQRFTLSPVTRVELFDRLLEENHRRAAAERNIIPDEGLF